MPEYIQPDPLQVARELSSFRNPRPNLDETYAPPETNTEKVIAECWEEIFGFSQLGKHDNFFNLGGDSLHMTLIASRARERLNVELTFEDFFSWPILADLSRRADELIKGNTEPDGRKR